MRSAEVWLHSSFT